MVEIHSLSKGTILKSKGRQYKIEKVIGHGAFGITYLAETSVKVPDMVGDIWLKVCIKEFFMHDYNSRKEDGSLTETTSESILEKYKSNFTKEANNLARLDNRNIVKVLDVIHAYNTCYIVMEFISGSNLDDYIKQKGRLEEDEAIHFAKEIAKAIGYMHSQKMLHLDLKPKNIMVDNDGGVHIIDFGLSKQYDNNGEPESSTTLGSGTDGYAPLEQGSPSDERHLPITIDVYALGGTLFKMLTGEKPPSASTVLNSEDILEKKLNAHQVSPQMVSLIKHAMQPMKGNRIPSMEALLKEMQNLQIDVTDEETKLIIDERYVAIEGEKNTLIQQRTYKWLAVLSSAIFIIRGVLYYYCSELYYNYTAYNVQYILNYLFIPLLGFIGSLFLLLCFFKIRKAKNVIVSSYTTRLFLPILAFLLIPMSDILVPETPVYSFLYILWLFFCQVFWVRIGDSHFVNVPVGKVSTTIAMLGALTINIASLLELYLTFMYSGELDWAPIISRWIGLIFGCWMIALFFGIIFVKKMIRKA